MYTTERKSLELGSECLYAHWYHLHLFEKMTWLLGGSDG